MKMVAGVESEIKAEFLDGGRFLVPVQAGLQGALQKSGLEMDAQTIETLVMRGKLKRQFFQNKNRLLTRG